MSSIFLWTARKFWQISFFFYFFRLLALKISYGTTGMLEIFFTVWHEFNIKIWNKRRNLFKTKICDIKFSTICESIISVNVFLQLKLLVTLLIHLRRVFRMLNASFFTQKICLYQAFLIACWKQRFYKFPVTWFYGNDAWSNQQQLLFSCNLLRLSRSRHVLLFPRNLLWTHRSHKRGRCTIIAGCNP